MLTLSEAESILYGMTQSESLLRHMKSVSLVMEAYARKYNEPEGPWAIAGLLHDADYEAWPEKHPQVIVEKMKALGEPSIAQAIAAHYSKWGMPCTTLMDKALLACDEITGFIVACCHVRPDGIDGLEPRSVIKKLKDKGFAAKVERDEVYKGIDELGVALEEHIAFIIEVLRKNKTALRL